MIEDETLKRLMFEVIEPELVYQTLSLLDLHIKEIKEVKRRLIKLHKVCQICQASPADSGNDPTLCNECMYKMAKGYNGGGY